MKDMIRGLKLSIIKSEIDNKGIESALNGLLSVADESYEYALETYNKDKFKAKKSIICGKLEDLTETANFLIEKKNKKDLKFIAEKICEIANELKKL